jgi:hypothetical protein
MASGKLKKILIILLIVFINCCGDEGMKTNGNKFEKIGNFKESFWENLSKSRIFFGHQSVGYNIIDGINSVLKENPQIKLNIVQMKDLKSVEDPFLLHSEIGENRNTRSKIDTFKTYLDKGLGENVDIALLKFCYVDFERNANAEKIFFEYKSEIVSLKNKYPNTKFIHLTSPLTAPPSLFETLKNLIKRIIGKPVSSIKDNMVREEYNNLLRNQFKTEDSIFDIAEIESTYGDGSRAVFEYEGNKYHHLVREYTDDGGHLNENGSKIIGEQLLIFLAKKANSFPNR